MLPLSVSLDTSQDRTRGAFYSRGFGESKGFVPLVGSSICAVWNPLDKGANVTLSNANRTASVPLGFVQGVRGNTSVSTGKVYWECVVTTSHPTYFVGARTGAAGIGTALYEAGAIAWDGTGGFWWNGGLQVVATGFTQFDILGFALDATLGTMQFYKNNIAIGTPNTFGMTVPVFPSFMSDGLAENTGNFTSVDLAYSPPAGFAAGFCYTSIPNIIGYGYAAGASVCSFVGFYTATGPVNAVARSTGTGALTGRGTSTFAAVGQGAYIATGRSNVWFVGTSTTHVVTYSAALATLKWSNTWNDVAWNGTVFCTLPYSSVYTGQDHDVETTPDGVTWTAQNNALPINAHFWKYIATKGTTFCAIQSGTTPAGTGTSTDGITWVAGITDAIFWSGICSNGTVFIAVSDGIELGGGGRTPTSSVVGRSSDGLTWTYNAMPSAQPWSAVCWTGSQFVAVARLSAVAATSTDGITWTQRALPIWNTWEAIAASPTLTVAISLNNGTANGYATSPDGITWTARTLPSVQNYTDIAYGNGYFVRAGSYTPTGTHTVNVSSDGFSWTTYTLTPVLNSRWTAITYGSAGKFIVVGTGRFAIPYADGSESALITLS